MAVSAQRPSLARPSPKMAWGLALLLFGVLDVAVTLFALYGYAAESHFAYLAVLDLFAFLRPLGFFWQLLATLTVWKIGALFALYLLYRAVPRDYRVGVPIGLATWGGAVLLWNLYAIGLFHRSGLF